MGLTTLQHEAYVMAILDASRIQTGGPLDRIENYVVYNRKGISPFIFSMLLNHVKVRDEHYAQILKILAHSCNMMSENPTEQIGKFFTSNQFFQQFIYTTMIVDEIWMLRKVYPEKLQEWKTMHRQVFVFRTKLLRFLEKQFGRNWTKNLVERAEEQRVRFWPLTPSMKTLVRKIQMMENVRLSCNA